MNREELGKRLKKLGVPEFEYDLYGGHKEQALTLWFDDPKWKVCSFERGQDFGLKEFSSEAEACEFFLAQFQQSRKLKKLRLFLMQWKCRASSGR